MCDHEIHNRTLICRKTVARAVCSTGWTSGALNDLYIYIQICFHIISVHYNGAQKKGSDPYLHVEMIELSLE